MAAIDEQDSIVGAASWWEPWTPEIGQRVRIRLSAECPALRAAPGEKETDIAWHSHGEDGLTGTVIAPMPHPWLPRLGLTAHPYLVDINPDHVHFRGCEINSLLYFAASELEPLTEPEG